jgi:DNA-binding response OmpR family regulator
MSPKASSKETILVVDDEPNILDLARLYLQSEGYGVITATDGQQALDRVRSSSPALVVLDLMLPQLNGWEVCRTIRAESDLPIIMLTARSDDVDKIVGLELGADDYLTKPFNPRELVARVRAVLRRSTQRAVRTHGDQPVTAGRLTIDSAGRTVTLDGETVRLTNKEFELLQALVERRGVVLSRDQLLDSVWGYDYYGETRTVDVHIGQLRRKIKNSGVHIETVRGIGYKLVEG